MTLTRSTRLVAAASALLLPVVMTIPGIPASAAVAPVGQGFTVNAADLAFILRQIKIAETHVANTTSVTGPCGALIGTGANQIPDALSSFGLRTVDGSCNNLIAGRERYASADQPFPRYTNPLFQTAEPITTAFPVGPLGSTSYAQKSGSVIDSQPRMISNLIVDQSATNPAAVAAAGHPVRAQAGAPGVVPCVTDPVPPIPPATATTPGVPAGCIATGQTLDIPNVTTDIGLSPPYNSLFTFFGQFFDHGVDQTVKGGGTVFVPLQADDPLIIGPDGIAGTADDPKPGAANFVPLNLRFMVLTRAQNQPGLDGRLGTPDDVQNANNTDTPWVDQSQTYTSHPSHQVFLREYVNNTAGKPISTGSLLGGLGAGLTYPSSPDGRTGMATWASVKAQAATVLGLKLSDADVTNIPMIATDPYGKFIPGPARGLPQYVTPTGMVEGNRTGGGVPVPPTALHFDTPFLTDIAHNADPGTVGPCTSAIGVTPRIPAGCLSPDADTAPSANFAAQPPGTYDDEMLNAHFLAGDGRVNENIALTTIHQVFHSEHDRLVAAIETTLTADTSPSGVAALAEWKLPAAPGGTGGAPGAGLTSNWNGERIFQAARYVNEMEYQHLVFEEFARKVQPAIQPFHVYQSDVNPAVHAEFAHAVYRFGHSMLDDVVARTNETLPGADGILGTKDDVIGSNNDIPLLKGFLNPPEYFNGGAVAGQLTPQQAAGSVIMGSSDQVGNELDEFVNNTLRNNLLGLPLDLATLNLTRARESGVPPLNVVRRQLFATSGDGQLAPYTSWADFGQNLKHPESLINFVAAYGLHPTITGATTLAAKRAAAKLIVDPGIGVAQTADQLAFMNSSGTWANTGTVSKTGLDSVDLWVGGLAEKTNLFGGLLGSTFNYVFENQLTDLQNGDRLYYLARTPGMNLRQQLEGNSFAELIMRNTEGTNTLKADAFATADCKFQLGTLGGTALDFTTSGPTVADDPNTSCNENALLLRKPDGTIQYKEINSVNPPGINSQSVYNGTPNADRVVGGNDNDTVYGNLGNDVINGNGGDDFVLGGDGNDIITDLSGADVLKGGPGNDAIDGGIGNDIVLGGDGQDFTSGGANDNETFGGQGNDFIMAGDGADAVFGDSGDDWIQGGAGQDLLQGDHGAPFFDDAAQVSPGNDIFIGQVGENDYDAEGGDDIMQSFPAIERNAGAGGFDWTASQFDTTPANADLNININLLGVPLPAVINRDRFQETEALSGWNLNDHLMGDSLVPSANGGAGFTGCDALDQTGIDRIKGLSALVPATALINKVANSVPGVKCPLNGPIWGEGNILLGGAGSDTIEGRGANDIIDGDSALQVRISVRTNPADPTTEIGSSDLMEHQYLHSGPTVDPLTGVFNSGNLIAGSPTLQQAVFDGTIDPGNLVAVREIVHPAVPTADCTALTPLNCDTAVFSGARADYTVTTVPATAAVGAAGSVTTVTDNIGLDGVDTLRNVEKLQFADNATPGAPTGITAVGAVGQATVNWVAPVLNKVPQVVTGFEVQVSNAVTGAVIGPLLPAGPAATTLPVPALAPGSYQFRVQALNAASTPIAGPLSLSSAAVTVTAAATPGAPTGVTATAGSTTATVTWAAPADVGSSPITGYTIDVIKAGTLLPPPVSSIATTSRSQTISGLTNGTSYTFVVHAVNATGVGVGSVTSNAVTPAVLVTIASLPLTVVATPGTASATVTWAAPANAATSSVTGYRIRRFLGTTATLLSTTNVAAAPRTLTLTGLTNGQAISFDVTAFNGPTFGAVSTRSNTVTPAAAPGTPAIPTATTTPIANTLFGKGSAVVRWTAPANGGSAITGYSIRVINAANGQVGALRPAAAGATTLTVAGLAGGTAVRFQVQSRNLVATGLFSSPSSPVTPTTVSGAPVIGVANPGAVGGTVTARANWAAPASNGGSVITSYVVTALRLNAAGGVVAQTTSLAQPASARSLSMTLVAGNYRFTVQARNARGLSTASSRSANLVTAR